jgi:hypothetical protein
LEQDNIFNTTPIASFDGFIVKVADYIYCLNPNTRILNVYNKTTYSFITSFSNCDVIDAKNSYLTVTNLYDKTISVYNNNSLVKTITSTVSEFGFSLSFDHNNFLFVGSPQESSVYIYSPPLFNLVQKFTNTGMWGYNVKAKEHYFATTNFNNMVSVYTTQSDIIGDNVTKVWENGQEVPKNKLLDTNDWTVLAVNLKSLSQIKCIGRGKAGNIMNAYVALVLFFNQDLTNALVKQYYDEVISYLNIR